MRGGIDHVMINCNDFEAAVRFYSWLMPKIGYPSTHSVEEPEPLTGWYGDHGSIWISPPEKRLSRQVFHKRRVGLREIAFRADSRAQIDELAREIEPNGGKILDPPREYVFRSILINSAAREHRGWLQGSTCFLFTEETTAAELCRRAFYP
jgi:catechol 2,3-dioxygenase-like lactoylglutathione lyase family enzyme